MDTISLIILVSVDGKPPDYHSFIGIIPSFKIGAWESPHHMIFGQPSMGFMHMGWTGFMCGRRSGSVKSSQIPGSNFLGEVFIPVQEE